MVKNVRVWHFIESNAFSRNSSIEIAHLSETIQKETVFVNQNNDGSV